jgi:hypothetical protein
MASSCASAAASATGSGGADGAGPARAARAPALRRLIQQRHCHHDARSNKVLRWLGPRRAHHAERPRKHWHRV